MITFTPETHSYTSADNTDWIGITTLVKQFTQPFDQQKKSLTSSRNKKSKWFGMDPQEIRTVWRNESRRSTDLGDWYHHMVERETLSSQTYIHQGEIYNVVKPIYRDGKKHAGEQKLQPLHVYPEHMIYLKSSGLSGQSDQVRVCGDNKVHILDHKTNKEIKSQSFVSWEGMPQMMREPVSHLMDSNYWHYCLQLSLYMYMILKHNPQLEPGDITLDHIIFDQEGTDLHGYPIYTKNGDDYIISDIKHYNLPYLKSEVLSIISYLKDNRELIKNKINAKED